MKIHIIMVKNGAPEDPPWIVTAWDEWSLDENGERFDQEFNDTVEKYGAERVRVGIVHVSDNFLKSCFDPKETKATKEDQG